MEAVTLSWIINELNPINIPINWFIRPNIMMWNRPKVFAFNSGNLVFIVETCSSGIYGHAHGLTEVKTPATQIDDALVYFTLDEEYMHSHTDIYYIAKSGSDYAIFCSSTKTQISHCSLAAIHWHSLKLRETFVIS